MTRIIAVRHAQSEGNLAGFFCGHTDVALSALGRRQAEVTANYLEHVSIDRIYSSDLLRVVMTARPTAERRGLAIIRERDLREVYMGVWEGLPHSEVMRDYAEAAHAWHHDFVNAVCTGGESVRQLAARVSAAFRRIADENPGRTVAVFSHGTPLRAMLTLWQGKPLEAINCVPFPPNASVTVVDYADDGSFTLISAAYDRHLHEAGLVPPKAAYEKLGAEEKRGE